MNREQINKDIINILVSFIIFVICFKIAFYKDSILFIIHSSAGVYWLFVLPGISITYLFWNQLKFLERLFIGFALGSAVIGITSYYLGLAGTNINSHHIYLPIIIILLSALLYYWKNHRKKSEKRIDKE